jgi:hypothetical protein
VVFTDDEAQLVVVARLIDIAQTPEAKEYVGILFPSVAEGDFVERHDNLKAYKYIIDKWPYDANETFNNAPWFDADFDEHFSSFNRPTWVIYDDVRVLPQGGALLVEADINKLNRDRIIHSQNAYNAYIVSSDLRAVPIVDSKTDLTVGQAYNGFAVQLDYVRDGKAYFTINVSDPSVPNSLKAMEFYIPAAHMEKAYIEPQNVPAIISLDMIVLNPMTGITLFREGTQQVIARFNEEVGPIQFIHSVQNGYLFILGMNLVHVSALETALLKTVDLGREFSLHIGDSASIKGEELQVKFLEITEDSRCPTGVVCVWEGRVRGLAEITYRESIHNVVLTEPGSTSWPSEITFEDYKITYHVEPYPQAGTEITKEEYRLELTISK